MNHDGFPCVKKDANRHRSNCVERKDNKKLGPIVKFPWKMSVFASLGLLCSVVAFLLMMPTITTSAAMPEGLKGHEMAGCQHYEQSFIVAGPQGGMTRTFTKEAGCNGGVWVQFPNKPYDMNVMVCIHENGKIVRCESQQNWFTPMSFTDNGEKMVDSLTAGTVFSVMFAADNAGEPTGEGYIAIDY